MTAAALALPLAPDVMIQAVRPDGTRYAIEKMDAHRRGEPHVAISAFVFDGPELLIQRRALSKYHSGGQWANTVCSHPNWGETPAEAAHRRLMEELGVDVALEERAGLHYRADVGGGLVEDEHVHVFVGSVDRARLAIRPDPAEVMGVRWARPAALRVEARAHPERFTPWFRIYLDRLPELGA